MHTCASPIADSCILQGYDLVSSGASMVTGRVAVPESSGTASLLASIGPCLWTLSKGLEYQPWAVYKYSSSGVGQA